jgi:hypothetical protein
MIPARVSRCGQAGHESRAPQGPGRIQENGPLVVKGMTCNGEYKATLRDDLI